MKYSYLVFYYYYLAASLALKFSGKLNEIILFVIHPSFRLTNEELNVLVSIRKNVF